MRHRIHRLERNFSKAGASLTIVGVELTGCDIGEHRQDICMQGVYICIYTAMKERERGRRKRKIEDEQGRKR